MDVTTWPAYDVAAVTPSDSTDMQKVARMLYIGTGGDVVVITEAGTTVTFKNTYDGSTIGPFFVKRVKATGTTASNILAYI